MSDIEREALEDLRREYSWWMYCRHATPDERREAHRKVDEIDKLLGDKE